MADATSATAGRVPFNAFVNALTTALSALAGFLTLPFLIDRLGTRTYGIWVLIVAVTGYFLIIDSGFTGAVGRLIAGKRSATDVEGLNEVVSTAILVTLPFCAVIALAASFIAMPFLWAFDVLAPQAFEVRTALLLVGLAMALSLPEAIFYALLWGYERFDLQNLVEIGVLLLRTTMIFSLIDHDSTVLDMAVITIIASAAGFVARGYFCWVAEPGLSIRPRRWSRKLVPDLLVFGSWFALLRLSRSRLQDVSSIVIGYLLGATAVTTFTVPRMLITYSGQLAQSVTQVVAPRAAAYHFARQQDAQRDLFINAGRYSLAISLYVFGGFLAVGLQFLSLWQHSSQIEEYQLLLILAVGEILPLSQWATYNAIIGIGKHRRLAVLAVGEVLSILVFSYIAAVHFGLVGAACAVAASALVFRGLLQCLYGCQLLNIPLGEYIRLLVVPVIPPAFLGILALIAMSALIGVRTWVELCAVLILYTLIYWAGILSVLLGSRSAIEFLQATLAEFRDGLRRPFNKSERNNLPVGARTPLPTDKGDVE